jgi:antagonist of KipI
MSAGFVVRRGGLQCTVQDSGRVGYQSSGIASSGALDQRSLAIANILVGNAEGEAGLEACLLGPELEIEVGNILAIAGADLAPRLNGTEVPQYESFAVQPGDILSFGAAVSGCRAYIAFAGGLDLPLVMGSKSTNLKCGLGGLEGRSLKAGDRIGFGSPMAPLAPEGRRRAQREDFSFPIATLRVVEGPQDERFTAAGLRTFYGAEYALSERSDRMGCLLEGPAVEAKSATDIVSDGVPLGAVQIPSEGKPIVMLADRQTTGGYAKIATVIGADIPLLAQRRPGEKVAFRRVSLAAARRAALVDIAQRAALRRKIERSLER